MKTPEESFRIMVKFQAAVKTGDRSEIDKLPLSAIKLAKAHLAADKSSAFYVYMVDYLQEREEREKKESRNVNKVSIVKEKIIFISHISEEAPIALALQGLLKTMFKNIPVFVSSDYDSILSGKKCYDTIVKGAQSAKVVLVLLSEQSMHSPWVNFEAGIGAGSFGEVIPIVARNLTIDEVPEPLKFLQVRDLRDPKGVGALIRHVAKYLEQKEPPGDWSNFTKDILGIVRTLPYQGLYLEPYCVQGGDGHSFIIQFKLINNGTTDAYPLAVEAAVPESLLLRNWARPLSISNLSIANVVQKNGVRYFCYHCTSYQGNISPGHGHPHRLPKCLTRSMSPHDFSTLRFVLRADLSENESDQTIEYKILAEKFVTEIHRMTIRELLKKVQ